MKLFRAVVLSLVCLTVLARSAAADCAWVLWIKETRLDYTTNTEERRWRLVGAAVDRAACDALLAHEAETVTPLPSAPNGVPYKGVDFLQFRADKFDGKVSRVQSFDYVCLPDSVDPRGPTR